MTREEHEWGVRGDLKTGLQVVKEKQVVVKVANVEEISHDD